MGEEGMTETQHKYLAFLKDFLETFINQGPYSDRSIDESLDQAWGLLERFEENQLPKIDKHRFFAKYHVFFR